MSEVVERRLQDPGEAELLAALEEASAAVGVERVGRERWRTVLVRIAGSAEGRWSLDSPGERPGRAFVAWWSDHRGAKHFRILSGEGVCYQKYPEPGEHDERPALWHVHPDHLYRVRRGAAAPAWLASCLCGATGRPQELAWMGPYCGPCHDRHEEGDPAAPAELPTLLGGDSLAVCLEFDPTGGVIAAAMEGRRLSLFATSGGETVLQEEGPLHDEFSQLTFSPDGTWLAVADPLAGEPILWPCNEPPERVGAEVVPLDLGSEPGAVIRDMDFSPKGDHFAACDDMRRGRLFRWAGSLWAEVRSLRGATALAFSGDGRTLAVGGSGGAVRLLSTDDGGQRGQVNTGARSDESVHFLAWAPGDAALILLTGGDDEDAPPQEQHLRRWDVARRRETGAAPFGTPSLVALSPDGRYLASVRHDQLHSPAAVYFWDLQAWDEAGWIEWNPLDLVHSLAFSPDGQWLATGTGQGGIKLIPWRLLLEG